MKLFGKYRFGFDVWGLILFLLVMLPNFIWFAVPAPNDVLRAESVTPVADVIASVCQVLTVACLCFVINQERSKLRFSPLMIATVVCVVVYYVGWVLYYSGIVSAWVILLLTIPPCLAFLFFAIYKKTLIAVIPILVFTICHLIYGLVNFVV